MEYYYYKYNKTKLETMNKNDNKKETEKKQKPKLSFQLIKNISGYTAIWLIDGKKHTKSILTDDKS